MSFYKVARFFFNIYVRTLYNVEIIGKHNIPSQGAYVLCSNHKANVDPIALTLVSKRQLHFMAKKQLFDKKILGLMLKHLGAFPVDRSTSDITSIKKALNVLKNGSLFGMFPEGTRTIPDINKAKPGLGMILARSKAPAIPISIESNYKFRNKLKITIKEPITFEDYHGKKLTKTDYIDISKKVLLEIYNK